MRRPAAALLLVMCMAPSAGNIGSCGQEAEPLDAYKFFLKKQELDCQACQDCVLLTEACLAACTEPVPTDVSFPEDCLPLVHDGEVCLDALSASGCADYSAFMASEGAIMPTECDFCPVTETGAPDVGDP